MVLAEVDSKTSLQFVCLILRLVLWLDLVVPAQKQARAQKQALVQALTRVQELAEALVLELEQLPRNDLLAKAGSLS